MFAARRMIFHFIFTARFFTGKIRAKGLKAWATFSPPYRPYFDKKGAMRKKFIRKVGRIRAGLTQPMPFELILFTCQFTYRPTPISTLFIPSAWRLMILSLVRLQAGWMNFHLETHEVTPIGFRARQEQTDTMEHSAHNCSKTLGRSMPTLTTRHARPTPFRELFSSFGFHK